MKYIINDDYDNLNEIEDIINTLEGLLDRLDFYKEEYKDNINELIIKANDEKVEVEERIRDIELKENEEEENQYWKGVI